MDIINAIKRLERAGDENSKATKKLHDAVTRVCEDLIETTCPPHVLLPRGYMVQTNQSGAYYLTRDNGKNEMYPEFVEWQQIDRHHTREGSLQFAKDVAEGLLDEIAEFLEKRKDESETATTTLIKAVNEMP